MVTVEQALARYPGAVTFRYGDSVALNAKIIALVQEGRKTVTCEAAAAFVMRGEPQPAAGRVDIALDWEGRPAMAVRTLAVEKRKFCDVTAAHIPAQGEFRDLADWRAGYEAYLRRAGIFDPEVEILLETFELVEVFA